MMMLRTISDPYGALLMAQGMETAGAQIISIHQGALPAPRALSLAGAVPKETRCFFIWARIEDDDHAARVDRAIEREISLAQEKES